VASVSHIKGFVLIVPDAAAQGCLLIAHPLMFVNAQVHHMPALIRSCLHFCARRISRWQHELFLHAGILCAGLPNFSDMHLQYPDHVDDYDIVLMTLPIILLMTFAGASCRQSSWCSRMTNREAQG
jgi:hypothetical protein